MSRARSPAYPNFPLEKALGMISEIFEADRRNIIDRETAAKHIGYSGTSGASDKALATLGHYNLLEKSGKGQTRVTQTAVDILHPDSNEDRRSALLVAGMGPEVFNEIKERFPDGLPSESALSSWLVRENFQDRAINPLVKSYMQTYRYLEQEEAFESDGSQEDKGAESEEFTEQSGFSEMQTQPIPTASAPLPVVEAELNRIDAEIKGDTVLVTALLDKEGLKKLAKKIAALSDFLDDE